MHFSSLNYKFLFILTLFNSFLSLIIGNSDLKITDNYIDEIILNSRNNYYINFKIKAEPENYQIIYLSLISKDKKNFTINSNEDILNNETYAISKMLNISKGKEINIEINSTNKKDDNIIQIIHIKKNKYSLYHKVVGGDDETIKINKEYYNFVKFLDDDKNIKVEIKFKDKLKTNISYGIVNLLSKGENYMPRVESFNDKGLMKEYDTKYMDKKEKTIKIENIKYDDDEKDKIYKAFILSINTTADISDYSIIINEDIMNTFLLGSIIVALVFAVITFFLIRRKQNVTEKKSGEEFLEEKQEEEKET